MQLLSLPLRRNDSRYDQLRQTSLLPLHRFSWCPTHQMRFYAWRTVLVRPCDSEPTLCMQGYDANCTGTEPGHRVYGSPCSQLTTRVEPCQSCGHLWRITGRKQINKYTYRNCRVWWCLDGLVRSAHIQARGTAPRPSEIDGQGQSRHMKRLENMCMR